MNAKELSGIIGELIEAEVEDPQFETDAVDLNWETFEDAGILTNDAGIVLVVTDSDGGRRKFQITVVESGR